MSTDSALKQKVYQSIEELPPEGVEELAHFIDSLRLRYRIQKPRKVVALGGLWEGLEFDVTDEDVRALRQRVTKQALERA